MKLSVQNLFGGFTGNNRFLFGGERADVPVSHIHAYTCNPFLMRVVVMYAVLSACIVTGQLHAMTSVLHTGCNTKVATSVVKSVPVNMIDNLISCRFHNETVHEFAGAINTLAPNGSAVVIDYPRTMLDDVKMAGANFCNLSIRQRDEKIIFFGNWMPLLRASVGYPAALAIVICSVARTGTELINVIGAVSRKRCPAIFTDVFHDSTNETRSAIIPTRRMLCR